MTQPIETTQLEVVIDYQQLLITGAPSVSVDPDGEAAMRAQEDAWSSGRHVGVSGGLVDLMSPIQYSPHAPMRVERWAAEPPADLDDWDHVVDVDLDVASGLHFEPSGGGGEPVSCDFPAGSYRARLAGRGYDHTDVEGLDSYRVQLWQRQEDSTPSVHKTWSGWARLR